MKIKEGNFDGPDIRTILSDDAFEDIFPAERSLWQAFRELVRNCLGKRKMSKTTNNW